MSHSKVPGHNDKKNPNEEGTPSKVPGQSNQPLHPGQHPKDGQGDDDLGNDTV